MSDSTSFFSDYRSLRLRTIAAKLALAPEDAWCGHETLSYLFQDRLYSGRGFHFPIRPSAEFTPESASSAAESLATSSRNAVLTALSADLDDPDYLTTWELLENAATSLDLLAPVSALASEAAAISSRLAAEMLRMPGADPSTPVEALAEGLNRALTEWAEAAPDCTPGEARLRFLGLLCRHVICAFPAPANFWEIMLLKLELAVASPASSPALARLLQLAFRVVWAGLPLQPALAAFWKLHASASVEDTAIAERITILAMLGRAGGAHAYALRSAITPDWVRSTPASTLCEPSAAWRGIFAQGLELAASRPVIQAADQWRSIAGAVSAIPEALQLHASSLRKVADDLAQGMPGKDTADQFVSLAGELLARTLWVATLTANPSEARELFLQPAVAELGVDPSVGLWKKLSRLSSALQQLAAAQKTALPWSQLAPLLRGLETRAGEIKSLPVRWSRPVPSYVFSGLSFSSSDGAERCARDTGHLLSRLAIEQRLHGAQRGAVELSRWYAVQVLPRLKHLPDEAFRERWDGLAETDFGTSPEHAALNAAARRFGQGLPRLTAAWKLEIHAEKIATSVAEEVMLALPDYARQVGVSGRVSCVRDNTLTLRQVASLLLSDSSAPHELLADWWSSAVGSYLATRPVRLFECNLSAIYHSLSRYLDSAEVTAAFTPIQLVYRENLGIECLESLTGAPTLVAGPLARRLAAGSVMPEPEREALAIVLSSKLAELSASDNWTPDILLNAFLAFHRERWTTGDADTAAARVLPQIDHPALNNRRTECASALLAAIADPSSAASSQALLLAESADHFILALGQSGTAQALIEHAPAIAEAYSEAMIAHAPDHFKHLDRQDAVARCRRDQTLLLRNLGERLARTAPGLFWVDATRWFLELLSPFVNYPAHVWALSARTVAKHLGPVVGAPENIFLARWVTNFEHLAAGWASSHALAKKVFNPTDYSFSARADEDRLQRDLLAAALVARHAPAEGPWSGSALYNRFLLSWPAAIRTEDEVRALLKNLFQVAGSVLPPGVAGWLEKTPALLAALTRAEGRHFVDRYARATNLPSARESAKILELASDEGDALKVWRHVRTQTAITGLPLALAQAAVRAHLLHPLDSAQPRALASSFPAAARARAGLAASCLGVTVSPESWQSLSTELMPHAASPNSLRSHLTTLGLEWTAIQAGVDLSRDAGRHASELLGKLEGGADVTYSNGAVDKCDRTTNSLAFAYAMRQTAAAVWDPCSAPPRLFFGYAADNHRLLNTVVAARAHARVNSALRGILPAGSALAGDAMLGIEAPLFRADGPVWREITLHAQAVVPAYVTAMFGAIRPVADSAAAYAVPSDAQRRTALADRLCHHLEALVCGLEESGDFEAAWELLLLRLSPDLATLPAAELVSAFYGLTRDLSGRLSAGAAVFWRTFLLATLEVVRQAAFGRQLVGLASTLAREYAASAVKGDDATRLKCERDQEHLLSSLGHFLSTQAPVRAWLNLSTHITEITLPHLGHGSLELASVWCRHEAALAAHLPPCVRPAAWVWLGALQRLSRNLPAVRPFAASAVPAISATLAARHGDTAADWRRWLSALAAAAATPDDGPAPGLAVLEKLVLATPLGLTRLPADWVALVDTIGGECETLLPGRVPNSLRRRLLALPAIAQRLQTLASGKGSRLVRACAAQSAHPLARTLWQASLLARARPDERLVESDPADACAAQAFGLSLEPDEAVLSRLSAIQSSIGAGGTLPLVSVKSGGLLARFGLGKKSFDWINNAGLRIEGTYVLEVLTLHAATGHTDASHLWYWSCPQTLAAVHPEKESGTLEFYQALAVSAAQTLGAGHPGAAALARFAADLNSRFAGIKLALPSESAAGPIPLHLLGLRGAGDAPAYAHMSPPQADAATRLASLAQTQGRALNEDQIALVQRAQAELLRSIAE